MALSRDDLFGLLIAKENTPLPLRDVTVSAEIQGYVLGLKSVLKYTNDSSDPVEVLFRFPLEDSHAVVALTAVIDGRKIKAEIKEKEEARAAYDDAIASGQSAALGEEKTGDVFSISLGNLPPKKEAEVHLELVGELPIDAEGLVRFSLPSTLKPRYTPAGSTDPLAGVTGATDSQIQSSSIAGVHGFELNVLNATEQVADVTSPTHTLNSIRDNATDKVIVTLTEEKSLDRDLVIQIEHKNPHQATVLVEGGNSGEGFMSDPAVMVNFFPDFEHVEAACEFIFLVDRSGSMSGSYIKSAGETLMLFMKSLPESCRFNIFGFGSRFEQLFSSISVPYTQETLDKAMAHLRGLQANLGGTELLPPLDNIFWNKPTSGFSRQVFVLTDGSVSNTQSCIQKVKENAHTARCFTFGIGSGASTALVEGLAKAGNGSAEFVKEGERMQPKVIRSLKRALQPSVTDVSVEFKVSGQTCSVLQSPQNLPPVYNGEKLVVYGVLSVETLPIKGTAMLKGQILGNQIMNPLPFKVDSSSKDPSMSTIHHLAAKALIKDWQNERKSKKEIVKLSIEGSVISAHTAFIAVNEDSSDCINAPMKTWDVQAAQPSSSLLQAQRNVASARCAMVMNIDSVLQRSDKLDDIQDRSAALNSQAMSFQKSSAVKKKGGFSFGSMFSGLFGSRSSSSGGPPPPSAQPFSGSAAGGPPPPSASYGETYSAMSAAGGPPPPKMAAGGPPPPSRRAPMMDSAMADDDSYKEAMCEDLSDSDIEDEWTGDSLVSEQSAAAPPKPKSSAAAPPKPKPSTVTPSDILTAVINAQQANGSWNLDSSLAQLFSKSLQELENGCPAEMKGNMNSIWATVLVLALLKKKFLSQQEEWELIEMKANSWLGKQALPDGLSKNNLFTAAEKLW